MEPRDEELIAQLVLENEELKTLVEAHRAFEGQLEDFNRRPYLTSEETIERKRLQKMKLAGKDRIATILADHRRQRT
jgi:hypothetical protein